MVEPAHTKMPGQHIRQLTGVRFFAAFGVVICHFSREIELPQATWFLADFMGSFVGLFFVLSGFVLTFNYHSLAEDRSRRRYRAYLVSRLARIVPGYWLALLIMLLVYWTQGFPNDHRGAGEWTLGFVLNLFALQAWIPDMFLQQSWNAPGWSISSELFFYSVLPVFLRLKWLDGSPGRFVKLWVILLLLLALYWLVVFQVTAAGSPDRQFALVFPVRLPLFGLFCFLFGINLARAYMQRQADFEQPPDGRSVVIATLGILFFAWGCFEFKQVSAYGHPGEVLVIYLVYTPYFYLLLRGLLSAQGVLIRGLSSKPMVFLGHSSYFLYLVHWPALIWLSRDPQLNQYRPWVGLGTILACVAVSMLVYSLYEDPLRRRIRAID